MVRYQMMRDAAVVDFGKRLLATIETGASVSKPRSGSRKAGQAG